MSTETQMTDKDNGFTKTEFFDNILDAVRSAAPEGATLRAVGYDRADIFLRAGYRVVEGDADITVARGGEREFALARRTSCNKLILVPTHAYAAAASNVYRAQSGAFAAMRSGVKPFAAVFDPDEMIDNLASVFGEIICLDLAAFDTEFGAAMRGEKTDPVPDATAKLLTDLTAALKGKEKQRAVAKKILTDGGKQAARLVERHPELLHNSGAAQATEALRMLCAAEDRAMGRRGETETLLAMYVTEFYIKSFTVKKAEFPPDYNKRIDSVCEYFHTDVRRACVHATPVYSPNKMRLYEYRRNEFRAEQLRMLVMLNRRRAAAWQVFKRLYPDDGFGLKNLVDQTDIGICLALAPDVFRADTLLSFLKQTGRLEKYIV